MRIISGAVIFLATASIAAAETQPVARALTWTGFYTGISLGAIFSESRLNASHTNFIGNPYREHLGTTDVLPGVHAGYNFELPTGLVVGGEVDFTYPDSHSEFIRNSRNIFFDKFSFNNKMQGAIRGRIGYALASFLPYVTTGVSFAGTSLSYGNEAGEATKKDSVQTGWVLGAGLEYAFYGNFSVRTEYLYTDYGDPISMGIPTVVNVTDPNGFAKADLVSHSVRAALNYRF